MLEMQLSREEEIPLGSAFGTFLPESKSGEITIRMLLLVVVYIYQKLIGKRRLIPAILL